MPPEKLIPLLMIPIMLVVVLLKNRRKRVLKPQLLWVMPAIVLPLIGLGLWGTAQTPNMAHAPFGPDAWAVLAIGGILGGVAGWYRGKTVTIEKEPDGSLMAQASPLGLILLVVLFAGRSLLRDLIESHAAAWHLNALAVTDAFLVFAMGLIVMQRVEMYIRARRIRSGGTDSHVEVAA
ncbi:CcdC protein domain-containing protein [Brevundimonas fontaquae]|nr:CcdC protein domain-containing protein [Brevundimonas fontaquae]